MRHPPAGLPAEAGAPPAVLLRLSRNGLGWLFVAVAVLAVTIVTAVAVRAGAWPYLALGTGDPGVLVHLADPLLRLCTDIAATMCVGALVFAAFFTTADAEGWLTLRAYVAVLSAGRWAILWCVAAAALVPVEAADQSGRPLSALLSGEMSGASPASVLGLWAAMETPIGWLITAITALVVGFSCRMLLRWRSILALLAVAVLAVLPPLVTGHSSSDTGHDLATAAIMIHVPAAMVWIGVLVALLRPRWRDGLPGPVLARRYRRLAGGCWLVLAVSGLVDAAVLVPVGQLVTTGYGRLLLGKLALVAVLGVGGLVLRRRALGQHQGGDGRVRAGLLTGTELVILTTTAAVSVGLTHLPPPAWVGQPVTIDQTLLGYNLAGPPTVAALVLDWRFGVLFGSAALLAGAGYLLGVYRLRQQNRPWPRARTAAWLAGCVVLLLATSSGIARYAAAMFSAHIAAHMLIAMLAPPLLVLGAPLSLARAARATQPANQAGPRAWLDTLDSSSLLRVLTHPLVVLVMFAGAPFALYFTGLFDAAVRFHWAHLAIDAVFLVIGYLFAWTVIGIDPLPRPLPSLARLGLLLAAMPCDIVFGAALINTRSVIGNGPSAANMYSALALPWVPSPLTDQHTAGLIALAVGEVSLLVAIAALIARWHHLDHTANPDGHEGLLTALGQRNTAATRRAGLDAATGGSAGSGSVTGQPR